MESSRLQQPLPGVPVNTWYVLKLTTNINLRKIFRMLLLQIFLHSNTDNSTLKKKKKLLLNCHIFRKVTDFFSF